MFKSDFQTAEDVRELNAQEMKSRMERARKAGVPMVNYGAAIAKMHGILERSVEPILS